jgi:small conductance mechanosensitive channel
MENFNDYLSKLGELAVAYAPKLLLAILTLIIGFWIIKRVVKVLTKSMEKRDFDNSLKPFIKSLVSVLLKIVY